MGVASFFEGDHLNQAMSLLFSTRHLQTDHINKGQHTTYTLQNYCPATFYCSHMREFRKSAMTIGGMVQEQTEHIAACALPKNF